MQSICDIVVLTWNKLPVTKAFVESLLENTFVPIRVIFVDNGSTDGTREYLSELKPTETCRFSFVFNKENKGYVKGNNQGLAEAHAPFVCFANNDLLFTPGWLSEMLEIMDRDKTIGLLNPNSNNLGTHPKDSQLIIDVARELKENYSQQVVEQPFCIGFCMLTRRDIANKVGGLSEEFAPMFFEDSDFSRKIVKEGFQIGAAKASYVYHQEHASMDQWGDEKEVIFKASRAKYEAKWGRTLRLAYVIKDAAALKDGLAFGRDLIRQGNFVTYYLNGINGEYASGAEGQSLPEVGGVKFLRFRDEFNLMWRLIIKKKRFDFVLTDSRFIRFFVRMLRGIPAGPVLGENKLQSLKFPNKKA